MKNRNYPYIPQGRKFKFVPFKNEFILEAYKIAKESSLDKNFPTGAVIVKDGEIISKAANGSDYHLNNICERVKRGIPTGEGYELCEGCHPKNHAEARACQNALEETEGSDIYLWGHWWACESCWGYMINAGIKGVYLLEDSEVLFNREVPGNLIEGTKQFEYFDKLLSKIEV